MGRDQVRGYACLTLIIFLLKNGLPSEAIPRKSNKPGNIPVIAVSCMQKELQDFLLNLLLIQNYAFIYWFVLHETSNPAVNIRTQDCSHILY
jgi:hypothetical protein